MNRQRVHYIIIALGVLSVSFTVIRLTMQGRGDRTRRPDVSPDQLLGRLLGESTVDDQREAAGLLLRHGKAARGQVREALKRYRGEDEVVLGHLLMAAKEIHDWQSMSEIFAYAEHENPQIRGRAGMAAQSILTADLGFHALDPPERRREVVGQMILRHDEMLAEKGYPRLYPD